MHRYSLKRDFFTRPPLCATSPPTADALPPSSREPEKVDSGVERERCLFLRVLFHFSDGDFPFFIEEVNCAFRIAESEKENISCVRARARSY